MGSRLIHFIARLLLLCAVVQVALLPLSFAAMPATKLSEEPIPAGPKHPQAPPVLEQPKVTDAFRCERLFVYKGKVFDCDSNVQRDAERLRPVIADVPAAVAQLDTYQRNRQNVRNAAYVGSIGLLAAIGGLLISRSFTDANGNLTATGTQIRSYSLAGGLGLTGISLIYGLSILSSNESHITQAVRYFNEAHPDTPIELQFSTGFSL